MYYLFPKFESMQPKAFLSGLFLAVTANALTQIIPLIEVQGQQDSSPYENQVVIVSGKVTEAFGDTWYLQDDYGAWNGLYVIGPDVVIPANVPYWNSDRQPEVGDVLELTGMVVEEDGNTQLVDVELVEFVDFWNATPAGIWTTAVETQDEQYEGTRIRLENATVVTAPDAEGYWTVALEDGEVTCWGVDTFDPSGNEDPDGPTPGDVYLIYGASHQMAEEYVLHVGDIDVVALSTVDEFEPQWLIFPNPVGDVMHLKVSNGHRETAAFFIRILNSTGSVVLETQSSLLGNPMDLSVLSPGVYTIELFDPGCAVRLVSKRFMKN
jgi:hypothetical protein